MGSKLNSVMLRFIPIGILINSGSSFIFHYMYNEDCVVPGLAGFFITLAFILVPWISIMKCRHDGKRADYIRKLTTIGKSTYEDIGYGK